MERTLCQRCGIRLDTRVRKTYCTDCVIRPANKIKYGSEVCIPHRGDFDEEDNPMLGGVLFMPGERTCGHADCVNPWHIPGYELD